MTAGSASVIGMTESERRNGGGIWCNFCGGEHAPAVCPDRSGQLTVMTDFELATELLETAAFLDALNTNNPLHLDRIARAVAFLRGARVKSGLSAEELEAMLLTDPAVDAIFRIAYARARLHLREKEERDVVREQMRAICAEPHTLDEDNIPDDVTIVPDLCERCKTAVIHRHFVAKETDPWQSWIILVQMLLLKVVQADESAVGIGGAQDYQAQLIAIGCLGCRYPRAMREAANLVRHRGVEFAQSVIKGEAKAANFDPTSLARRRT